MSTIAAKCKELSNKVVYILYRDDILFYIGKAKDGSLYRRMRSHATNPRSKRYLFWNYFSAFIVQPEYIDAVEALLISSMPAVVANDAAPKLRKVKIQSCSKSIAQGGQVTFRLTLDRLLAQLDDGGALAAFVVVGLCHGGYVGVALKGGAECSSQDAHAGAVDYSYAL